MLHLSENETVLLVMRRHWFRLLAPMLNFLILFILPSIVLIFAPRFFPALADDMVRPVINFFLALYLMGLLTCMTVFWVNYYLDTWIITDKRIIDIEQHGLFHREISEISLERIQNVTVEIPGFMETLLQFGNIKIQTAGEDDFTIPDVPHCDHAKDILIRYSRHPSPQTRIIS